MNNIFTEAELTFILNANTEGLEVAKEKLATQIGTSVSVQLKDLPENEAKTDYISKTIRAQCEVFCATLNKKLNTFKGDVLWRGATGTAKKAEVKEG